MYEKVEKSKENAGKSVANSVRQKKSHVKQDFGFVDNRQESIAQRKLRESTNNHFTHQQQAIQKKENKTGLPDNLKSGIENLSGYSLDDVKVHRNSDKPAQIQAHAYAQGTDIYLASGQENHLPHEAWHLVQQKQGRVMPTKQMKGGVNVNDDEGLEKEADEMGNKALQMKPNENSFPTSRAVANSVVQKKSNGKQGFGFVDNRPEAIIKRKQKQSLDATQQKKNDKHIRSTVNDYELDMRQDNVYDQIKSSRTNFSRSQLMLRTPDVITQKQVKDVSEENVKQLKITRKRITGGKKQEIETYVTNLNEAVNKAWAVLLATPLINGYQQLDGYTNRWVNLIQQNVQPTGLHTAFGYAVETLATRSPLSPIVPAGLNVLLQNTRGGTRPDIILTFQHNDVAWLDITASASGGHIDFKENGWRRAPGVAEVTYPSIGQADIIAMNAKAIQFPNAVTNLGVDPQTFGRNAREAKRALRKSRIVWNYRLRKKIDTEPIRSVGLRYPDPDRHKRNYTVNRLRELISTITEKQTADVLLAAKKNPKSYGFATGFRPSVGRGIMILQDRFPED